MGEESGRFLRAASPGIIGPGKKEPRAEGSSQAPLRDRRLPRLVYEQRNQEGTVVYARFLDEKVPSSQAGRRRL